MKISGLNPKALSHTDAAKNKSVEKSTADAIGERSTSSKNLAEASGSAKVDLSERAQMMQRAADIARKTEVDNSDKIARLQKMIDEGSYKVDSEAVADRLVDEHATFYE